MTVQFCNYCKTRPVKLTKGKGRPHKTCGHKECQRAMHIEALAVRRVKIKAGQWYSRAALQDAELAGRLKAFKPPEMRHFALVNLGDVDGLRLDIGVGGGLDSVAVHIPGRTAASEYVADLRAAAEYMEKWAVHTLSPHR